MPSSPPPDCSLSDDVEGRASVIEGQGLFATSDLPADSLVSRLGGRLVSDAELRRLIDDARGTYIDTVSIFDDANLVLPAGTSNHWGNHSCAPNLWWVDPYTLHTRIPVHAGDELTVDYGTLTDDPTFEMPCHCGAKSCRGRITGVDWQRPELQVIYGDQWVPVLRDCIKASRQNSV